MKSILVSNLNNLGDVVCSTAALDLLRRHFPGVRVGLMVKADAEGVVRGHPLVDDLYVYRYKSGSSIGTLRTMAAEVREKGYEVFLSLDRKPRSALVAWLAGIKTRITPDRLHIGTGPRWWMPLLCTRVMKFKQDAYHSLVDMFEEPVRQAFGIEGKGRTSIPPVAPEQRKKAAGLLAPAGDRPKVGFSVRANAELKNWPPERFAELMDRLEADRNVFVYVTGAPGDKEYIDSLLALRRNGSGLNLAGQTSLMDTAALAAMSELFITLDTGAVHVAGNSGIKNLICIFTCTEPEGVLESARQAHVFWTNEPCCPCGGCEHESGAAPCQTGVTVDMVHAKALELLDGTA